MPEANRPDADRDLTEQPLSEREDRAWTAYPFGPSFYWFALNELPEQ
jgi:hypothetical protein